MESRDGYCRRTLIETDIYNRQSNRKNNSIQKSNNSSASSEVDYRVKTERFIRSVKESQEQHGLIPRVLDYLFEERKDFSKSSFHVSFLEIYNDQVTDLLASPPSKHDENNFNQSYYRIFKGGSARGHSKGPSH
jgi:hypothetical protein